MCDDEEDDGEEEAKGGNAEEEHLHLDMVEVSLNSVVGFTPNHTMKVKGQLRKRDVIVLIDSGATHNFISNRVVHESGLQLTDIGSFGVVIGTRRIEKGRGVCREVLLSLPGVQIWDDFHPLDLGSMDVILGMQWLQMLREIKVN